MARKPDRIFLRVFPRRAFFYIAREFCLSLAVSFLFFFIVFFVNQILLLAEDILAKNAPFAQTALLLFYSLPSVIAIAFPFAALAGALMTSARLNSDNEIMAFSAAGLSPASLYAPFLAIGLAASLLSFTANDYFLPRGSAAFRRAYSQLVASSAAVELGPYVVKRYPRALVVTGAAAEGGVEDIVLFETEGSPPVKLITAEKASIGIDPSGNDALIEMRGVLEQAVQSGGKTRFSISLADQFQYRFRIKEPIVGFPSGDVPSEMSARDLLISIQKRQDGRAERARSLERQRAEATSRLVAAYALTAPEAPVKAPTPPAPDSQKQGGRESSFPPQSLQEAVSSLRAIAAAPDFDRSLQIYEMEFNKKLAIPTAAFFFALLAFPLGLGTRRTGRTAGFGIALLLSTIYWALLFAGQTIGLRSEVPPALAMWAPNFIVFAAAFAAWLIRRLGKRRIL